MQRLSLAIFTVLMLLASSTRAEERTAHVAAAEKLVESLDPQHNEYAYKEPAIKWKGDAGVEQAEARCDCSGFVTLLLEHVYGYTPQQMKSWTGRTRPVARIFHDQIEASHGFVRIDKIDQIKRGDIIAVKYLEDRTETGKVDTGHVMVVVDAPKQRTASAPVEPGTSQWEVAIIDSSKSGHGTTDTRRKPDKTYNTGVGRGVFRLYSDEAGKIVGYAWSTLPKSEFYPPDKHHLVVGRLDPDFKP